MNLKSTKTLLLVFLLWSLAVPVFAQRAKTNTRVFWIDRYSQKLTWGDLVTTNAWSLKTGSVDGFPKTDSQINRLGPLFDRNGLVVAGISQIDNEKKTGRWVAIDAGVFQEPHGNHFHWKYTGRPTVTQTIVQDRQGSAVRIGSYNDQLYLVGDQGYTAANLNNLRNRGTTSGRFFPASYRSVAQLAVVDNAVGYSAWNDSEGEHAGQIDVVKLLDPTNPAYSFKLPSGNISATAVSNGRVFFAHENAVSWITPDRSISLSGDKVQVNTVQTSANQQFKLETTPKKMVSERNWVIFTTGTGDSSKLCMIDAAAQTPTVTALPIKVSQDLRLSPPSTVLSMGKRYAFIFQERVEPTSNAKEQLTIVELDPNRDMRFNDARVVKTIPVGSSLIKEGSGSHEICFDDYGRFAMFTNPGDGTLSVMSMHDLQMRVNFNVGGVPTSIVAVGAPEHFH